MQQAHLTVFHMSKGKQLPFTQIGSQRYIKMSLHLRMHAYMWTIFWEIKGT